MKNLLYLFTAQQAFYLCQCHWIKHLTHVSPADYHMVTRQLTVDKDMKDADRTYVLANEIWQEATSCWVTNCKAVIRK